MCGEYVLHSLEPCTHAGHPGRISLWSVEKMTRLVTKRSQHNGRPCSGKNVSNRGGSKISGKGAHICKGMGVCFADIISFFLNILKTGSGEGVRVNPLNPL